MKPWTQNECFCILGTVRRANVSIVHAVARGKDYAQYIHGEYTASISQSPTEMGWKKYRQKTPSIKKMMILYHLAACFPNSPNQNPTKTASWTYSNLSPLGLFQSVFRLVHIWVFPKIGIPPNHPILISFSIIHHPFWGTTIFGNIHLFIFICNCYPWGIFSHPKFLPASTPEVW